MWYILFVKEDGANRSHKQGRLLNVGLGLGLWLSKLCAELFDGFTFSVVNKKTCKEIWRHKKKKKKKKKKKIQQLNLRLIIAGAILTEDQRGGPTEMVFKYAISRINRNPELLPNTTLTYDIHYVNREDSFHASKKSRFIHQRRMSSHFPDPFDPSDIALCRRFHEPA